MSLPDASGQAREALCLAASGALSRALIGAGGLIGRRLARWIAAIVDIAALSLSAGLCAAALFVSGGEARPPAFLFFALGLFLAGLPAALYRRMQEKRRRAPNTKAQSKEG